MQYSLQDDVLMERADHSKEWRPVPYHRIVEAAKAVGEQQSQPHAVHHEGNLGAKVIRANA